MSLHSLRLKFAAILISALVCACGGGSSAPPPVGGITVVPGDGQVTVTWTSIPDVEYWLFYAPAASISTKDLSKIPNHVDILKVTSPYVVSGLANGVTYSFTLDGRTGGGPGGEGTPSVSAVPRLAGTVWTPGTNGALGVADMRGIAFGTASDAVLRYVAVGAGGAMYTGTDGTTWSVITGAGAADLNAAVYTLSKYIAVGAAGSILTSADTITWSAATSNTTARLNAITSNGAMVVAVGDGGTVRTSTDGVTWATPTSVSTTANLYGVNYAGTGLWTAVGAGGVVLASTDALTWTTVASGTSADLKGVAVFSSYSSTAAVYVYTYAVVGDAGTILSSTDGLSWTRQTLSPATNLQAIVAQSGQFVAVGSGGAAFTSADGATWVRQASGVTADLTGLIYTQGQYLAVGKGGASTYSR
jgi:hypothetical protein